jgi:hypothetical protein
VGLGTWNTFEDESEADAESVESATFAGERAREPRAVAGLLIRERRTPPSSCSAD